MKMMSFLSVLACLFIASMSYGDNSSVPSTQSTHHVKGTVKSSNGALLTNAQAYILNTSESISINRRNATFDTYVSDGSIIVFDCPGFESQQTDPITQDDINMSIIMQSSSSSSASINEMALCSEKTQNLFSIKGKVIDGQTGRSLTNASWYIEGTGESGSVNRRDASFQINNLSSGSIVTFSCSGYLDYSTEPINQDESNLTISLSSASSNFNVASFAETALNSNLDGANPLCSISGKVSSSTGQLLTRTQWHIDGDTEVFNVNSRTATFSGSVPVGSILVFECPNFSPYQTDPITENQSNMSIVLTSEDGYTMEINIDLKP